MKLHALWRLCPGALILSVISLPLLRAAPPPAAAHEFAAVEQFLNLDDAELEQLQQVIARLRALSPAERAVLRQEIARYRSLPDDQRQHLRQGWGRITPELQAGWREMMQHATPGRRAEIQSRLQSLSPEEKVAYRRQLVEEYLRAKAADK